MIGTNNKGPKDHKADGRLLYNLSQHSRSAMFIN